MGMYDHLEVPSLTVLNYSGGKQSSALLWMVLRGEIKIDKERFIVLNANPGMENALTYKYVDAMRKMCELHDIYFETVKGPNLYNDITALRSTDATRMDNPPFWTKGKGGKKGRLVQKCTQAYKIVPMDRRIRAILEERYGVSRRSTRMPEGLVEKWIGFSFSEVQRIKPSKQKYVKFRYPLIEKKLNNDDVLEYFAKNDLPLPPRSVCNACFANGLVYFYEMYHDRKEDWGQAVAVDEAARDWTQIGVNDEVYVSQALVPLRSLESIFDKSDGTPGSLNALIQSDLGVEDDEDMSCDSGYCFV